MSIEFSRFSVRIDPELLKKFRYVAEYNARSANREIVLLMKNHVEQFERVNGEIVLD